MVAAGHPATARAGAEVLADGGNAVDAAVAAAFAAAVAESALTGPGAGGFLLYAPPAGAPELWDFFVAVPGLDPATPPLRPDMLHAFTVPFGGADQVFHIGPASVAVPGMVQGLSAAAAAHGALPLTRLVEPAVALARAGVEVSAPVAYLHEILGEMLMHTPAAAAVYGPGGTLVGAGERLVFADLAATLERIGADGATCMHPGGWLAEAIVAHQAATGGRVRHADLEAYRVERRQPLETRFRGRSLVSNPPPSAGGLLIAAALAALDEHPPPHTDAQYYRAVAWAGEVANGMRDDAFFHDLHRDLPRDHWRALRRTAQAALPETRKPAGSTTHISVVDAAGAMVSLSSSNGAGSGVMVPGTGVLLNNMLGEEDLNPDGFGTGRPGSRLTSMMAPTIVERDGVPAIAVGAAGSNRLRSAITQTVVSLVDQGLDAGAAVRRARVHPEGGGLDVEGGISSDLCAELGRAGHALRRWDGMNLFFGGVSVVARHGDELSGAGDPRRGGGAFGTTRSGEVVEL